VEDFAIAAFEDLEDEVEKVVEKTLADYTQKEKTKAVSAPEHLKSSRVDQKPIKLESINSLIRREKVEEQLNTKKEVEPVAELGNEKLVDGVVIKKGSN